MGTFKSTRKSKRRLISDFKLSDSELIKEICLGSYEETTELVIFEKLKNYKNSQEIKIRRSNIKEC